MKGITKDHESITKDFKSSFYSMKDQCKKNSYYISRHTFPFPSIGRESPPFLI